MSTSTSTRTTLDDRRTDQLGTLLTVAAAADLARTHEPAHQPHGSRRRLAFVGVAALLLAGAVVLTDHAPGGPRPGRADAAVVSIVEQAGWQVIELTNPQASAQQVVDQLEAAGIDARVEPGGTGPSIGGSGWLDDHPNGGAIGIFTDAGIALQEGEAVPAGRIVRIDVAYPGLAGSPPSSGTGECTDEACGASADAQDAWLEANGVRADEVTGTVSVKSGSGNTVIVSTAT